MSFRRTKSQVTAVLKNFTAYSNSTTNKLSVTVVLGSIDQITLLYILHHECVIMYCKLHCLVY